MSFAEAEESVEHGSPIIIYEFRLGPRAVDVLRYTDADEDVFHADEKWSKETITMSEIQQDGSLNKAQVTITVPQTNEVARLYTYYPPSYVVTVRALQGNFSDPDREFKQIFTGRVLSCQMQGVQGQLTCEPASTSLKRVGLRRNYQRQCPLALYGTGVGQCNAAKVPVTCSVESASGNIFRVVPPAPFDPGPEAFSGGVIEWINSEHGRTEIRAILRVDMDGGVAVVRTAGPIHGPGATVTMLKGCAHTEEACSLWHNNINNYGGQVWIPIKSPFGTLSEFF